MSTNLIKKISKELADVKKKNDVDIPDENNLRRWIITIIGNNNSYYKNKEFKIDVVFPNDYPYKCPKITFLTKIFHPNIDENGNICLDLLRNESWVPSLNMTFIINAIQSLLSNPNCNDPLNIDASNLFRKDKNEFIEFINKF